MPGDPESTRTLLNRIVLDVRAACELLEQAQGQEESDSSDRSDNSDGRRRGIGPGIIPKHGGYRNWNRTSWLKAGSRVSSGRSRRLAGLTAKGLS
ncbi:MAG: hypothetical protein JXR37_02965 [Kiritimatiellae bacterium]|nr:hypothetical protein [Kiritimatiellia bacterium]